MQQTGSKGEKALVQQALSLMDLTSLNDDDTQEVIETLCSNASTEFGHTAAVCVYGDFVKTAKLALKGSDIQVATVANFPCGSTDIEAVIAEIEGQVADGADEIDVVIPYKALIDGDDEIVAEVVAKSKAACGDKLLKVIIESGELKTKPLIKRASEIAIENGADFIKTSTSHS